MTKNKDKPAEKEPEIVRSSSSPQPEIIPSVIENKKNKSEGDQAPNDDKSKEKGVKPKAVEKPVFKNREEKSMKEGTDYVKKLDKKKANFFGHAIFTGDEIYVAEINEIIEQPSLLSIDMGEPRNFEEATRSVDRAKWEKAMIDELDGLKKRETYELVPRPKGKNVVGSKWVYKIKLGPKGEISRYKARLVAQGFSQIEGLDFNETFAPVARLTSIRSILSFAIEKGLKVYQLDIDQAYLYGDLEEEIYMEQPKGFIEKNSVWRLRKNLYGLKQAGTNWYNKIRDYLLEKGFAKFGKDPCIFGYYEKGEFIIVAIYVDDILYLSSSEELRLNFRDEIAKRFQIKDLGIAEYILGISIDQSTPGQIFLNQEMFLRRSIEEIGLSTEKPLTVPISGGDLEQEARLFDEKEGNFDNPTRFRSAIGKLMYAMVATRPDIAFATNFASRFMHAPNQENWELVKRIWRYVAYTVNEGLLMKKGNQPILEGYCDASYGDSRADGKSSAGYLFFAFGCLISWQSKKQAIVTTSTAEAEYISLAEATKEGIYLADLFVDLKIDFYPLKINVDNTSAKEISKNERYHGRTKNLNVKFFFVRDEVKTKRLEVVWISTDDQLADVLTKPLAKGKMEEIKRAIGVTTN